MSGRIPSGYYRDDEGFLRRERRKGGDRRKGNGNWSDSERRRGDRRKANRERMEREYEEMIDDALAEFAADHES